MKRPARLLASAAVSDDLRAEPRVAPAEQARTNVRRVDVPQMASLRATDGNPERA